MAVICSFATHGSLAQTSASPVLSPQIIHTIPQAPPPETQIPKTVLVWDSLMKERTANPGDTEATFSFSATNISTSTVVIDSVTTSCGCTVARLPATPWILQPGSNGQLEAVLSLTGKTGTFTKAVMIHSNRGEKTLLVRAVVGQVPNRRTGVPIPFIGSRERNQQLAKANRQAVFQGDCAKCHAEPARNKSGELLYGAVCGICHDAEHRAESVPDLHLIDHDTNPDFWRGLIAHGKADSMMPAFALDEGGPLNSEQVNSLVNFLEKRYGQPKLPGVRTP
jgi:mono/diheme cytochrome c family protein